MLRSLTAYLFRVTAFLLAGGFLFSHAHALPLSDANWQVFNDRIPGLNATVEASTAWNDNLYVGGEFTIAGATEANHLARWDGAEWHAVGGGLNGPVDVLGHYQGDLIVAGDFNLAGGSTGAQGIARWNGTGWSAFGPGVPGGTINAMAEYDDELYIGGTFTGLGTDNANYIARWTGTSWRMLENKVNNQVHSLLVYGDDLIAGGQLSFDNDFGYDIDGIGRWDGERWWAMDEGVSGTVRDLVLFEGDLIAVGEFLSAGDTTVNYVARWDGDEWSAMGEGGPGWLNQVVVHQGEVFVHLSGFGSPRVSRWDGDTWSELDGVSGSFGGIRTMTSLSGQLIIAGSFNTQGDKVTANIVAWEDGDWILPGEGLPSQVLSLLQSDQGLYVGGYFASVDGTPVNSVALRTDEAWQSLGIGLGRDEPGSNGASVYDMTLFENDLIVAGRFDYAGETAASNIARWDGESWHSMGEGLNGRLEAVMAFEGELYTAGVFTRSGSDTIRGIARWVDGQWQPVLGDNQNLAGSVFALAVHDGRLIAGGFFEVTDSPFNVVATNLAAWDGETWTPIGDDSLLIPYSENIVNALAVHQDDLIIGGDLSPSDSPSINHIARWDGEQWHPLANGMNDSVDTLHVYNDYLIASGEFTSSTSQPGDRLALWDGTEWHAMGSGIDHRWVWAAEQSDDGTLHLGGNFYYAGNQLSPYLTSFTLPTVQFDSQGGSAVAKITVAPGESITLPLTEPERTGHSFTQWNTEPTGDGDEHSPGAVFDPAPNSLTLHAIWETNQYTLTLQPQNGETSSSSQVDYDDLLDTLAEPPEHTGHSFVSWNTESDGTGTDFSAVDTMPAEDLTLYAQWSINPYTVTFDTQGGTHIADITQDYNSLVSLPDPPTREGYSFTGWNTASEGTGDTISEAFAMPEDGLTLYAQWAINSYTISFDNQGGSTTPSITQPYNSLVSLPGAPTREGHDFDGWNTQSNGNGLTYTESDNLTMPAGNLTLYAQWVVQTYTISFNSQGGSAQADQHHDYGTTVSLPVPSRTGHTFWSWNTESDITGTTYASGFHMPAHDLMLYAEWQIDHYTVVFDSQGGSTRADIHQEWNTTVTLPDDPVRTGHSFDGWNTQSDGAGITYTGDFNMPEGGLTLYAQWAVNSYTISFDSQGGSSVNSITQDFDSTVSLPEPPIREGYSFLGWNTHNDGIGTTYTGDFTMPEGGLTLYAQWAIDSYTISFESQGGTSVAAITQAFGSTVSLPEPPTREGHIFAGWNTFSDGSGDSISGDFAMPEGGLTLYAQWAINSHTISFETQGGDAEPPITADFGTQFSLPQPLRDHHSFISWNTQADGSGTAYTTQFTMPDHDVTLYAQWQILRYSVHFDSQGGSSINSITQEFDSTVNLPPPPTRFGYTFLGWNTESDGAGDTISDGFNMPEGGLTLYAQWEVSTYTISFDSQGGSAVDPITQAFGSTVSLPDPPMREGHTFIGWDIDSDGGEFLFPDTFDMPDFNVTLYAQWQISTHTVTFIDDDGHVLDVQTIPFGSTATPPEAPELDGFEFIGWSVPLSDISEDLTAQAQYEAKTEPEPEPAPEPEPVPPEEDEPTAGTDQNTCDLADCTTDSDGTDQVLSYQTEQNGQNWSVEVRRPLDGTDTVDQSLTHQHNGQSVTTRTVSQLPATQVSVTEDDHGQPVLKLQASVQTLTNETLDITVETRPDGTSTHTLNLNGEETTVVYSAPGATIEISETGEVVSSLPLGDPEQDTTADALTSRSDSESELQRRLVIHTSEAGSRAEIQSRTTDTDAWEAESTTLAEGHYIPPGHDLDIRQHDGDIILLIETPVIDQLQF